MCNYKKMWFILFNKLYTWEIYLVKNNLVYFYLKNYFLEMKILVWIDLYNNRVER